MNEKIEEYFVKGYDKKSLSTMIDSLRNGMHNRSENILGMPGEIFDDIDFSRLPEHQKLKDAVKDYIESVINKINQEYR